MKDVYLENARLKLRIEELERQILFLENPNLDKIDPKARVKQLEEFIQSREDAIIWPSSIKALGLTTRKDRRGENEETIDI